MADWEKFAREQDRKGYVYGFDGSKHDDGAFVQFTVGDNGRAYSHDARSFHAQHRPEPAGVAARQRAMAIWRGLRSNRAPEGLDIEVSYEMDRNVFILRDLISPGSRTLRFQYHRVDESFTVDPVVRRSTLSETLMQVFDIMVAEQDARVRARKERAARSPMADFMAQAETVAEALRGMGHTSAPQSKPHMVVHRDGALLEVPFDWVGAPPARAASNADPVKDSSVEQHRVYGVTYLEFEVV